MTKLTNEKLQLRMILKKEEEGKLKNVNVVIKDINTEADDDMIKSFADSLLNLQTLDIEEIRKEVSHKMEA